MGFRKILNVSSVDGTVKARASDNKKFEHTMAAGAAGDLTGTWPNAFVNGYVLATDGSGTFSWVVNAATSTRKTTLFPQFPGVIFKNDGGNNEIDVSLDNTGTAQWENLVQFLSEHATVLQDVDMYVSWQVPATFTGFTTDNAIDLRFKTLTIAIADQQLVVNVYKKGTAAALKTVAAFAATVADTVEDKEIAKAADLGAISAGDTLIFHLKAASMDNNYIQAFSIVFNYVA